ncbi:hypothetical protein DFJ73DRAFT_762315 [Zopfochytrium polystomum]|nr:hypothetical protein DFJ73DRAFT_762315 [Zopfochytrium polystomum]
MGGAACWLLAGCLLAAELLTVQLEGTGQMAERSKALRSGRSLERGVGSNPTLLTTGSNRIILQKGVETKRSKCFITANRLAMTALRFSELHWTLDQLKETLCQIEKVITFSMR